jgi:gliding motility-associated protein GldM
MAGGKLSPRQKMINMMYLVLMALLALNVSKQILLAFGNINESITNTTSRLTQSSDMIFDDLNMKFANNPEKYEDILKNANKLREETVGLVDYINDINNTLTEGFEVDEETGKLPWANMDQALASELLFPGGDPKAGKGQELVDKIRAYVDFVTSLPINGDDSEILKEKVRNILNTDDVYIAKGAPLVPWIKHQFEHYPLAACITFLSQIKADIRNVEAEVLSSLTTVSNSISVNTVEAIPIAKSTSVIQGGNFEANVILAAYDSTLAPEVFLYQFDNKGNRIGDSEEKVETDGSGLIKIAANKVGEYFWGGVVKVTSDDGNVKSYPFKSNYSVNTPSAVISADKMNVLYRGVDNPLSVSVPGIDPGKISLQGPGLTKLSNGNYVANVTNVKGYSADYSVVAEMEDGTPQTFPSKMYRVKPIPAPRGLVAMAAISSMSTTALVKQRVSVDIPNFDFDLKFKVNSFDVKIPGFPSFKVTGDRIGNNNSVKNAISKLPSGSEVYIRNINASVVGKTRYNLDRASDVTIMIN